MSIVVNGRLPNENNFNMSDNDESDFKEDDLFSEESKQDTMIDFQGGQIKQALFDNSILDEDDEIENPNLYIEGLSKDQSFLEGFEDESMIREFTQTQLQNTRDPDQLDQATLKKINKTLHECILKFTVELIQNTKRKTLELGGMIKLLQQFRISKQLLKIAFEEQKHTQQRNIRNNRVTYEDHLQEGDNISFTVHDGKINPFFFSFNQTLIFINNKDEAYNSLILDNLDSYLRHQKETIYITSEKQEDKINHLVVQFGTGFLKFNLKCGIQEKDSNYLFYDMLKLYSGLNPAFKNICAFLSYWADQRGILQGYVLPEMALYCMIIDFFQINDILPRIFDQQFCPWSDEKKKMMTIVQDELNIKNQQRLLKENFKFDEYVILNKYGLKRTYSQNKDIIKTGNSALYINQSIVHFLNFPRSADLDFVKQKWMEKRKRSHKDDLSQTNYGVLVAKFFHTYALGKVQKRKIDITGVHSIPSEADIGYNVVNPLYPDECLTKFLKLRTKNKVKQLPKAYGVVKSEFERAYDLITQCKFQELCEKRKTFINAT